MVQKEENELSEEELIGSGFAKVRAGILAGDWHSVLDGYNLVSGENLSLPEKKKSKLEKIRESIQQKSAGQDFPNKVERSVEFLDRQEKDTLPLKKKDLKEKPEKSKSIEPIIKQIEKIIVKNETPDRLGRTSFEIIQTPLDSEEKQENESIARPRIEPPATRQTMPQDTSKDNSEERSTRFYSNPPRLRRDS